MSQRRYGGGGSGSGGTASVGAAGGGGASSAAAGSGSSPSSAAGGSSVAQQSHSHKTTVMDENEDTEQAELVDEMGRLSPASPSGGAGGMAANGRGANSIVRAFRSSGKQAGFSSSAAGLVVIWLFIAVSLLCTMMSGSIGGGADTMRRIGGGGPGDGAGFGGETNVWVNGSGRTDLTYKTVFNPDDLTMTGDECDAFFPDLYKEVDRSKQYYTDHTTFDRAYLERTCDDGVWTHARVVIYNNRLYIKYYQPAGFTRGEAALALLHQSLITSREKLPNVEFCIGLHDWGSMGKFSLDRPPEVQDVWLMPDYSFWSWPEHVGMYNEMREKERKIDQQIGWEGKKNTLFWRGSMKVGTEDREALMAAAQGHTWNEMSEIVWGSPDKGPILLEDHCKYKFHAYPDGNTYSGRLRYLQNCAVVVVTHPQKWIQHYTHLFNGEWGHPDQNIVYIPGPLDNDPDKGVMVHNAEGKEVGRRRNWERLPEVMENLLRDDAMAKRIANNVLKTFRDRYVVPATAMCYWRRSLRSFAAVQKYDVSLDGTETSYENFLLHGMRKPEDVRN